MELSPIVIFAYNRPYHIKKSIDALKKNLHASESNLIVFSDGFKSEKDKLKVEMVRSYIKTISGFKSVSIIEREKNFGLAKSIILGVTEVVNSFGKIIVLEDDLITSPYFLDYMNNGLEIYEADDNVASINGFFVPVKKKLPDTFFLNFADCLGWATWKRAWADFEIDGTKLLGELTDRNLLKKFDLNGAYNYTNMLNDQIHCKNDSWAIRWYASTFLKNKLSLCPRHSLVQHIGNDGTGTHVGKTDFLFFGLQKNPIKIKRIPICESSVARDSMIEFFRVDTNKERFLLLKRFLPPILFSLYRKFVKPKKVDILNSNKEEKPQFGWFGNYSTWEQAKSKCTGYESEIILEKCKNALLKVKIGEAEHERDSVLFNKVEYSYPLLAGLMWVAAQYSGNLNVIDFGGSLGSTYFQNKLFLKDLKEVRWNIVEQEKFVDAGKELFSNEELNFFYSIKECCDFYKNEKPNTIILSSVIQYMEDPLLFLKEVVSFGFDFIIIDRTLFNKESGNILTIQKVPAEIFEASYPCWFVDKNIFISIFVQKYELITEFDGFCEGKGFIFKKKDERV